jgi:16S rRNA (cytidine1402-2'-O)-methyltransferase
MVGSPASQVLFEAPHRIEALATEVAMHLPGRRITLGRELTKQFETVVTMDSEALPGWLAEDAHRRRGEFVIVLHGAPAVVDAALVPAEAERMLAMLLDALPLKQAVAIAASLSGAPRNALYDRALALRDTED